MKDYRWNGANLYDVFKAGVSLAQARPKWTEEEWFAALDAALPKNILAQLKDLSAEHWSVDIAKKLDDHRQNPPLPKSSRTKFIEAQKKGKGAGGK